MTQSVTLSKIRNRAVYYANLINLEPSEWNVHINDAAREYWNEINNQDQLYNLTQYSYATTGDATYALPSDFFCIRGADMDFSNDTSANSVNRVNIEPLTFEYRNSYKNVGVSLTIQTGPWWYSIQDNTNIIIQPTPSTGKTIIIWYIPVTPTLSSDSDTIDGIDGFDVYISALAAKTALDSRAFASTELSKKLKKFKKYMRTAAGNRIRDMRHPIIRRELQPRAAPWGIA